MNGTSKKMTLRRKLHIQQRGQCYWCREPMTLNPANPHDPYRTTLDHIDDKWSPLRGKGRNKNVAAHKKCNEQRAAINEAAALKESSRCKSN